MTPLKTKKKKTLNPNKALGSGLRASAAAASPSARSSGLHGQHGGRRVIVIVIVIVTVTVIVIVVVIMIVIVILIVIVIVIVIVIEIESW